MKVVPAFLLATVLILGGCSAGKSVVKDHKITFLSPQAVLQTIDPVIGKEPAFKFTAKVSAISPSAKLIFKLAIITQAPDRLRIESIPVFGPPDFFFASQDGWFQIYLPASRDFFVGAATPDNLSRALPVSLSWPARRWVTVLQGRPDIPQNCRNIKGKMEGAFYRLDVSIENAGIDRYWINTKNGCLERIEYTGMDGLTSKIDYSSFKEVKGRNLPLSINIDAGDGTKILIMNDTPEVMKQSEENRFALLPPADATLKDFPN
ncbi:MAG: hypothetical protein JW902_01505 [Syntrophaceae bacterium]|nr:hypothetical protein [Syntrophaceae bacterium]